MTKPTHWKDRPVEELTREQAIEALKQCMVWHGAQPGRWPRQGSLKTVDQEPYAKPRTK